MTEPGDNSTQGVPPNSSDSLSGGAIAGITISSLLGVALIGLMLYLFAIHYIKRRRARARSVGASVNDNMPMKSMDDKSESREEDSELEDTEDGVYPSYSSEAITHPDPNDEYHIPKAPYEDPGLGLSDSLEISPSNNISDSFDEDVNKTVEQNQSEVSVGPSEDVSVSPFSSSIDGPNDASDSENKEVK